MIITLVPIIFILFGPLLYSLSVRYKNEPTSIESPKKDENEADKGIQINGRSRCF